MTDNTQKEEQIKIKRKTRTTQQLLQTQYYFHASSEFFFYHTSIPSDMSKTFPKHSDKRSNIVRCLLDVTVLPE